MRIRIQLFTSMRIRILLLIKVANLRPLWYCTDPPELRFEPLLLHCGRPGLHFKSLKLQKILFLDLAFHTKADQDLASKNNADPDPQPFPVGSNIVMQNFLLFCFQC